MLRLHAGHAVGLGVGQGTSIGCREAATHIDHAELDPERARPGEVLRQPVQHETFDSAENEAQDIAPVESII